MLYREDCATREDAAFSRIPPRAPRCRQPIFAHCRSPARPALAPITAPRPAKGSLALRSGSRRGRPKLHHVRRPAGRVVAQDIAPAPARKWELSGVRGSVQENDVVRQPAGTSRINDRPKAVYRELPYVLRSNPSSAGPIPPRSSRHQPLVHHRPARRCRRAGCPGRRNRRRGAYRHRRHRVAPPAHRPRQRRARSPPSARIPSSFRATSRSSAR